MIKLNKYDRDVLIKELNKIQGMKVDSFLAMMEEEKDAFVCSDYDGDKMLGFMYATREFFDGEYVAFIQLCFNRGGSVNDMLDYLDMWMFSKGLEKSVFMTQRNHDAFSRRYKFKKECVVMSKELAI